MASSSEAIPATQRGQSGQLTYQFWAANSRIPNEREPQGLSGWRRGATRAQAPIALGGRDNMDRPLSDEEKRILETAAHCLPGGALGSTRLPDDLGFIVRRASGSKLCDVRGRDYV